MKTAESEMTRITLPLSQLYSTERKLTVCPYNPGRSEAAVEIFYYLNDENTLPIFAPFSLALRIRVSPKCRT